MPTRIELDYQRGSLRAVADGLTRRKPLHAALGARVEGELREWFRLRDGEGNARGWPSQHFWDRIRKQTALGKVDEAGAEVVISDPAFNQKLHGGTIKPREGKYLALPAVAEAYGHSPREFGLHPIFGRGGVVRGLAENYATAVKFGRTRKDGTRKVTPGATTGGRVMYWLVESVTQEADERALPPEAELRAALSDEADAFFAQLPAGKK